jgi:hypothetical protein
LGETDINTIKRTEERKRSIIPRELRRGRVNITKKAKERQGQKLTRELRRDK